MIRKVTIGELPRVMNIINDAKELLSHESTQWQQGYPNDNTMTNDINNGNLYGYYLDSELIGIVAFVDGFNPDYEKIDGAWKYISGDRDFTIHRIAVKKEYYHQKIGDKLFKYSIEYAKEGGYKSIKTDTTELNMRLRTLATSNGFEYRGIIKLVRDEIDPYRMAFEYNL